MRTQPKYLSIGNLRHEEWSYKLPESEVVVLGIAEDCHVWVPNPFGGVSPHHAQIDQDRRGHWLRDLVSVAGTAVNGVWIGGKRRASLELGDALWMGGVEIEVLAQVTQLARVAPKAEKSRSVWKPAAWAERCRHLCAELGQAEIDVLLWFSRGLVDDPQIARALHRATDTVRTERSSIYRKLEVHDRAELQAWLAHSTRSVPPGGVSTTRSLRAKRAWRKHVSRWGRI
jgi:DNA-binding CsgD family transcriptional regulator